jgi:hypothetical protein
LSLADKTKGDDGLPRWSNARSSSPWIGTWAVPALTCPTSV